MPSWYANLSAADGENTQLEEYKRYRLRNALGYEIDVLSLGATITAIRVRICIGFSILLCRFMLRMNSYNQMKITFSVPRYSQQCC